MSVISSINFKKSNNIQTRHNDRDLPPNYLIGGNFESNRNHTQALALKNKIIQEAIESYTSRTGQKFQAKSYEWSAVVNLKPDSTMADLENLAAHFNKKYGFQCYQIAIHRDEGYIDEQGNKQINHHAHLEFITLDKSGKSLFRAELQKPKALRQMQSEVAEILKMQRGVDKRISNAKRIEPRIYAKMKEDSKAELRNERAKNKALQDKLIKERLEQERKAWIAEGGHTKEDYAELRKLKEQAYTKIEDLEKNIAELRNLRKKDFETFEAEQTLRADFEIQNDKLLKKQTELALELKNKDEVIQNLENQNKTLKIENKGLNDKLLEKSNEIDLKANFEALKAENKKLKHENKMFERALECIYNTPNAFQFAYKQVIKRLINYLKEPTAQNLKRTSIKELTKEFDETSDNIENNVKAIRSSDLKEQRKQELIKEARFDGITLERAKEIELELKRTRGLSR